MSVSAWSPPQAYEPRFGDADKAASGLGDRRAWLIPYWHTDAAMATKSRLLLLEELALDATLWGSFRNEGAVLSWADINNKSLLSTVLVGHDDGQEDRSARFNRSVPMRLKRVRYVSTSRDRQQSRPLRLDSACWRRRVKA